MFCRTEAFPLVAMYVTAGLALQSDQSIFVSPIECPLHHHSSIGFPASPILFICLRDTADPDIRDNECVGLDESDALCVLALDILDKLVPANRHTLEQVADFDNSSFGHGCRSL